MSKYDMTKLEERVVTLRCINGRSDGIVIAEMFNGLHVLTIPYRQLTEGLAREETSYPGVYLLRGKDGEGYIGESENVKKRIKSRPDSKDKVWWSNVTIITTKGKSLHKTQVKYLEARLIEIAKQKQEREGWPNIKNRTASVRPNLPAAVQPDTLSFLRDILLVLPFLGIDWFTDTRRSTRPTPATKASGGSSGRSGGRSGRGTDESKTFEIYMPKLKIRAIAKWKDGKFVVQKGSQARPKCSKKIRPLSYIETFENLCRRGVLKLAEDGSHRVFTEDYAFNSQSAAGSVVTGRSCNGPKSWKPV